MESRRDWTTSEGTFTVDVYDGTHDNVERINYVTSPGTSSDMYYEQASGHGGFTRAEDRGPVNEYYIIGDTRGSEAGDKTGASIRFRPVTIDFVETNTGGGVEVDADTIEYIPPHTRGDKEFGGHGPRVWCNVEISVRNQTEIWAEVYMKAKEIRGDGTTAEGTETFRIYTHDRPIREILSDTSSDTYYVDNDHAEDVVTMGGGDLVKEFVFVGDTRGSEAGTRTGVVINFNPIMIRV